jgi:hypothetical protein
MPCSLKRQEVTAMRLFQSVVRSCLAGLFLLVAVVEVAWTQATSPAPAPDSDPGYGLLAFVCVIALLVMVGAAVKLYDMKRKREDEAVAIQARLSDTLLTEPALALLPVTPTVRRPLGWHAQAVITLAGTVPTRALRDAVLQLVNREAASLADNYRIEDRLLVDPRVSRRAA